MKLAELLMERKDIQIKLAEIKERMNSVVRIQEGDTPEIDPLVLIKQFEETNKRLVKVVETIEKANQETLMDKGKTLAQALVAREGLRRQHLFYTSVINQASEKVHRYSNSEIKDIVTVDLADLHKKKDQIAKKLREIDAKIQEKNWNIEVEEK
ncbi:hypothetical protein BG261_00825 [Floricoccus tropicus]|uniref:DIP1984 family protein n=1 Tax=Floricoccus tropicus TaxID=1859473 RepID=A0A1E8GR16_9LACT|nr:DIP1984 family protein [Floricoccus tropicus]OFI50456.1 hypothetical protein BG261_00825 [Floricoccus tropicus]